MSADLSIVVVHWNVPDFLRTCLRSIRDEVARSDLRVETLVIDNGSPDAEYRAVVEGFQDVTLIELTENRGYAAGCNAGIAESDGEAILLLNPDTELLPGSLESLRRTLHVANHVGMVAPLLLNTDGSLQSAGYRFPGIANVLFDLFQIHPRLIESPLNGRIPVGDGVQPLRIDYPLGAAMLVRRSAVRDVGLLDESYVMYSEEVDWAQRFGSAGWTVLLAPSARVTHHGGQSTGQRRDAMREALWLSRARYYERWASARARRVIGYVVAAGTRFDDLRSDDQRRASNARIRERFRAPAGSLR